MRRFLLAVVVASPLAACAAGPTSEPIMEVKSPIWFQSRPVLQPAGYATVQPAAAQYVPVQSYAAPAPACAPPSAGYTPGYQYAPPPIPR